MFKYLKEIQIPEQFRCVICLQICQIPIQCYTCLALNCYQCIIQNKNQCGRGCRQKIKKPLLKAKTVKNLEQIKCKCETCQEFVLYKSYRKHTLRCSQQKTESHTLSQDQVAIDITKNFMGQIRISKFKLRRIIFPCLQLFLQKYYKEKQRKETNQIQFLNEFEQFFSLLCERRQISKEIFKCEGNINQLQKI